MSAGESREQRAERRYAQAETSLEQMKARRVQRGPQVLIGVLVVLTLGVGLVVATDLRRLMTPTGTALAWTGAATFGDCRQYEQLSVPEDGAVADELGAQRCGALQEATREAREDSSSVGIVLREVRQEGDEASAEVVVTTPEGMRTVLLPMVRVDDGWAVVRTAEVCRLVGCV